MAKAKTTLSEDERVSGALHRARSVLHDKGVASGAMLGAPPIRERVVAQLVREGFERCSGKTPKVRVPLQTQVLALLSEGTFLPLTQIAKRARGMTSREARATVAQLVKQGQAHLVLRGKALTLVPIEEPMVAQGELSKLVLQTNELLKWVKKAKGDKLPVGLLSNDLREVIGNLGAVVQLAVARPSKQDGQMSASDEGLGRAKLRGAMLALRDEDSGLISVPAVSRRLEHEMSVDRVKELLLEDHQAARIELRPEGGIGRLSSEDAARCPPGAGGVPLSWARLVENEQ